jgi:hypothetical protein
VQDPLTVILWIVAIIIVSLTLILSHRLVVGKTRIDATYALKVIIIAVIIVFIIPIFSSIFASYISELAIIVAYTIIILLVRFLISKTGGKVPWGNSILIAFITVVILFIINFITQQFLGITIVSL